MIKTKIVPPSVHSGIVERKRLEDLLPRVRQAHLSLVYAPAGYGKTTLLLNWHRALKSSGMLTGWLTIDADDRTPAMILGYLADMFSSLDRGLARGLQGFAAAENLFRPEAAVAALTDGMMKLDGRPVYIFLDDFHLLGGGALTLITKFMDCAPENTHFIVASRGIPDLHIGRARALGQFFEVTVEDLLFTPDEAERFMTAADCPALQPEQMRVLLDRTEGWVTGLKLTSLYLRRTRDVAAFLASFSGCRRAISDFFAEDVFAFQNDEIQEFLLRTSVLDRLCPQLCDEVTGLSNGRVMLDQIESSGLFLIQLDDERVWYRYHSLFSDFLRRRLAERYPGEDRALHWRAAQWLAAEGAFAESFQHAERADQPNEFAALLGEHSEELTYHGKIALVAKYGDRLPSAVVEQHPKLLLTLAWRRTRGLDFRDTRRLLKAARRKIDAAANHDSSLSLLLLHREMMLCAAEDDMPRVEEQCQKLISAIDDVHPYIACTLYTQLIAARREQFRFDDFARLEANARAELRRSDIDFALVSLDAVIGHTLIAMGRTEDAKVALEQGLSQAVRFGGLNSGISAIPALPLAELSYELNDLDRAKSLIDGHLPVAREFGFVDQLLSGHLIRPRLLHASGDLAGALRALEESMKTASECGLERLKFHIVAEQIRLLIRSGQPDSAADVAAEAGLVGSVDEFMPKQRSTTRDEVKALAVARLALSRDQVSDAQSIAKQWRSFCQQRGAVRSLIRWSLLQAQILMVGGKSAAAQRILHDIMAPAAKGRFLRCFLDEGPVIGSVLADCYRTAFSASGPAEQFAGELLALFNNLPAKPSSSAGASNDSEAGLYGRLASRELEILTLVAHGMRNREIGARLGLTEGTVKWYMQQIYDKVGVRRRPHAVDRARQFGLIA